MITRWWRRVVSCLYPHLCPDHFASFSTFGFFRGLHKSDSLYWGLRQSEKHCVVTRSSDVRLRDHPAPGARVCGRQWSPGPGLISVNCEWVRASLDSLFLAVRLGCSCAPGWAGDTDTDTVLPGAGLPIPGPWQLTALCWTLGRSLSAGLWSLVSRAGSDVSPGHTAAQARPGRGAPVLSLFGSTVRWSPPWSAARVTTWWSAPGPWWTWTWTGCLLCDK